MPKNRYRENGEFASIGESMGGVGGDSRDEDKLTEHIQFRLSSRDYRRAMIQFHQHRQLFGWEVPSDMFRDMLMVGAAIKIKQIKNPGPELLQLQRQGEELAAFVTGAMRHVRLRELCDKAAECVQTALQAGDLFAARKMLIIFREHTEAETDPAIKERREAFFDKQWGALWDSLNRTARLPFTDSDIDS